MHRAFFLLFLLGTTVTCTADNLTYLRIERSAIEKRLQTLPATEADRVKLLREQFKTAGCAAELIEEQAVPGETVPNVICTLPGGEPGAILVGARLDYKAAGSEDLVNWGNVAMLPLLAESINSAPHRQTVIFAAFTGHDRSFAGANFYLKQLTDEQRSQIRAMIDLDKVGRTPAAYAFPGPSTSQITAIGRRQVAKESAHEPTTLSKVLPMAARALKLTNEPQEINDIPATDARVFEEANIRSLVIHSVAYTTISPPGKFETVKLSRDTLDPQVYTDTYNLMCVYLLFLDKAYSIANAKLQTQVAQSKPPQEDVAPVGTSPDSSSRTDAGAATAGLTTSPAGTTASESLAMATASKPPLPQAGAASDSTNTNPVFRTTTRLVQVDVVVTDKQGRPIPGLKQSDFTVMQDGKKQNVHVFEAHGGKPEDQPAVAVVAAPKLPPNTYSNHPSDSTADSWTIVLYDLLNTPTTNQEYARTELLKLLHAVPKGRPVALYLLTNRLTMVQGFTDDPDKLLKAADTLKPGNSHVLTTEAQRQHDEGQIQYTVTESLGSAPVSLSTNDVAQGMIQSKEQQLRDLDSFQIADRAAFTLAAFESLSRSVSGYPGRKNLIWLSASFPIQIEADSKMTTQPWRNSDNFKVALASAGALLAKSRIAVYPVDVRGLQNRGPDVTDSSSEVAAYTTGANSRNYGDLLGTQASVYTDERSTMKEIAEQTGGEAFLGTNDLRRAMERSIDDGSTYYTLAYTPDKIDPQTAYHRIDVKTDQPGVKLSFRRGYYSTPQKSTAPVEKGVAALRGSLQPGMPQSTVLFLTASVQPPDPTHKNVRVQYVVNPNSVTFTDVPDGLKRIVLDCIVIAYDKDGHEVAHASDTMAGTIKPAAFETVMNNGIPAQQELTLPPGAYNLRLGVMDRPSQQIGTVDVPLVITAAEASAKN